MTNINGLDVHIVYCIQQLNPQNDFGWLDGRQANTLESAQKELAFDRKFNGEGRKYRIVRRTIIEEAIE